MINCLSPNFFIFQSVFLGLKYKLSKLEMQESLGKQWYCKNYVSLLHLQYILLMTAHCPQEHLIWINYKLCNILKISLGHFLPSPCSLTWADIPVKVHGSFAWDICSDFHFCFLIFSQCFAPFLWLLIFLSWLLSARWGVEMSDTKKGEKEICQKRAIRARSNGKHWQPAQN